MSLCELSLKLMRLHHSIAVDFMLEYLLFDNVLAKFEQVDTHDKVLFRKVIALSVTRARDRLHSQFLVFHYFFKTEQLILTQYD